MDSSVYSKRRVLLAAIFLLSSNSLAKPTLRCAFDIGSGSTKLKIAEFNESDQKIAVLVGNKNSTYQAAVPYAASFNKKSGKFSSQTLDQGVKTLKRMIANAKQQLKSMKKSTDLQCVAVATAIFRTALEKNPKATKNFFKRIETATAIKTSVITQKEEALLGYYGARYSLAEKSIPPENILMWDVGASSMQIAGRDLSGKANIHYGSEQASEPTFQLAMSAKGLKSNTPNPIGKGAYAVMKKSLALSAAKVGRAIRGKIAQKETVVVGIGPLHKYSILGQVSPKDKNTYSIKQVRAAIVDRLNLSDQEVVEFTRFGKVLSLKERADLDQETREKLQKKLKYARTDVSNLILIHAFMHNLGIQKVRIADANLTEGVLTNPKYWN